MNILFIFYESKIEIPGIGLSRPRLMPSSEHIFNPNMLITLMITTLPSELDVQVYLIRFQFYKEIGGRV